MINPGIIVKADLKRNLVSSLGVFILLGLAFSASLSVSLIDRALRTAGADTAQDYDLVVGAPGSKLDLVLASVFLRSDQVLPLLKPEVLEKIKADPRVSAASPLVFSDHYGASPLIGIDAAFPQLRPSLQLEAGTWPAESFQVCAGADSGLKLGQSFKSAHGIAAHEGGEEDVHNTTYTVVGLLKPSGSPWDRGIYTPAESIWEMHEHHDEEGDADHDEAEEEEHDHHEGEVSAILVKPKTFADAYALRTEYQEGETLALFPAETLVEIFGVFDEAKSLLNYLALAFQIVVFLALILSLMATLPSKIRWIGLLRSLGAGKAYIFLSLWLQSALVFLFAALFGGLIAWGMAGLAASWVQSHFGLRLVIAYSSPEFLLLGLYALAGFVAALLPAFSGFSLSPRKSLLNNQA